MDSALYHNLIVNLGYAVSSGYGQAPSHFRQFQYICNHFYFCFINFIQSDIICTVHVIQHMFSPDGASVSFVKDCKASNLNLIHLTEVTLACNMLYST